MKYFKKIIIGFCICLYFFCGASTTFANSDAKKIATFIKDHISENFKLNDQFPVYDKVRKRISDLIIEVDPRNTGKRQLFKDLAFYHNNNILELVAYITSREGSLQRFTIWKQETIKMFIAEESLVRENFTLAPEVIYLTKDSERAQDGEIYKYTLRNPVLITEANNQDFIDKLGFIIYQDGKGLMFTQDYTQERKIPFVEILSEGSEKFLLYSDSVFRENAFFSTYAYDEYYSISGNYGVYISDIEKSGNSYSDAVFLRLQDAKNNITFAPEVIPIVQEKTFPNISQESFDFINTSVADQLRFEDKNYDTTIKNIKTTAENITVGKPSEQGKILAIYDWMIQNIEYPKEYNIEDPTIFSGLEAFENGSAVCEGQARLMYYMLKSVGVQDVQIIDGYVVNADDFPQAGHAWIQIGDTFYDPSFETVYQSNPEKYNYYNLPYDIAYINRYNLRDIPQVLFTRPRSSIDNELERRAYALTNKYPKDMQFKLLERAHFQKKFKITIGKKITLKDIKKFIPRYEINIDNGVVTKNTSPQQNSIEYTPFTSLDNEIENLLIELDYNLNNSGLIEIYRNGVFSEYGIIEI